MLRRLNALGRKELIKGRCVCRNSLAYRLYTTNSKTSSNDKPVSSEDLVNDDYFWEIPTSTPRHVTTKKTNNTTSPTLDFRRLLDTVLDKTTREHDQAIVDEVLTNITNGDELYKRPTTTTATQKASKRRTSLIEQRLLDMVIHNKKVFKERAPLPRSMMPALYGKTQNGEEKRKQSISLGKIQLEAIRKDKSIQAHDREIKTIDDILSTNSRHALLDQFSFSVMEYQQQQSFPSYYARLVKNAIQHAYTTFRDPYLAVALFEQCKSMSVESYINGCTADVYNQVLNVRWEAWKDIYGILDLMEEMTLNGIAFNDVSASIVQTITEEMEQQEWADADNSKQVQMWSPDDVRSTELMKILVGKWVFK
ncbi:uncharacterized protein BX664DRAFT_338829 [Halteromyces radiatus]|uniref:uncharacterized protein n=1 Tax=Halteromyces radiatus TaxID=101107 RepID=UPI00221E443E|nr:uncharacterized protein BX664DRAFT_338829 [Halteromyces radiatus]KAI8085211.1 hypothetical protein BX664DRAFT_338829 [Halteromyces radiatus]